MTASHYHLAERSQGKPRENMHASPAGDMPLPGGGGSAGPGRRRGQGVLPGQEAVVFIFALPSILLVLLGSIFGNQAAARGVTVGQFFTAGMIAGGIMSHQFPVPRPSASRPNVRTALLKRLSGTPMPRRRTSLGKVVQVPGVHRGGDGAC